MDCKYTCFDRVLHLVNPLSEEDKWIACELVTDYSLIDLLDYGVEKGCFSKPQSQTLYEGIIMWENLDGTYYEEDDEKLIRLYDAMGITEAHIREYQEQTEDDGK